MRGPSKKHVEEILKAVIVIAAVVLIALCVRFIGTYRHLRQLNYIGTHHGFSLLSSLHARGPLTTSDVSLVQSWMTFDYINHLFSLPPQYLQSTLSITDSRYPRLTIEEYAEDAHLNQATLLTQVQSALTAHFTSTQ